MLPKSGRFFAPARRDPGNGAMMGMVIAVSLACVALGTQLLLIPVLAVDSYQLFLGSGRGELHLRRRDSRPCDSADLRIWQALLLHAVEHFGRRFRDRCPNAAVPGRRRSHLLD